MDITIAALERRLVDLERYAKNQREVNIPDVEVELATQRERLAQYETEIAEIKAALPLLRDAKP